jgi:hypothetical protein
VSQRNVASVLCQVKKEEFSIYGSAVLQLRRVAPGHLLLQMDFKTPSLISKEILVLKFQKYTLSASKIFPFAPL